MHGGQKWGGGLIVGSLRYFLNNRYRKFTVFLNHYLGPRGGGHRVKMVSKQNLDEKRLDKKRLR